VLKSLPIMSTKTSSVRYLWRLRVDKIVRNRSMSPGPPRPSASYLMKLVWAHARGPHQAFLVYDEVDLSMQLASSLWHLLSLSVILVCKSHFRTSKVIIVIYTVQAACLLIWRTWYMPLLCRTGLSNPRADHVMLCDMLSHLQIIYIM
jgi:hypothetical protein